MKSTGFKGSNKQGSSNLANLPKPPMGNRGEFQETPSRKAVASRKPLKK